MSTRSVEEEPMRRSTRRKLDKIGLATISVGVVVLAAFGLKTLMGSGSDPESTESSEQAFIPYETNILPEATITPSTPAPSADTADRDGRRRSAGRCAAGSASPVATTPRTR